MQAKFYLITFCVYKQSHNPPLEKETILWDWYLYTYCSILTEFTNYFCFFQQRQSFQEVRRARCQIGQEASDGTRAVRMPRPCVHWVGSSGQRVQLYELSPTKAWTLLLSRNISRLQRTQRRQGHQINWQSTVSIRPFINPWRRYLLQCRWQYRLHLTFFNLNF